MKPWDGISVGGERSGKESEGGKYIYRWSRQWGSEEGSGEIRGWREEGEEGRT